MENWGIQNKNHKKKSPGVFTNAGRSPTILSLLLYKRVWLSPFLYARTQQLNDLELEASTTNGSIAELKEYELRQLKINEPITKITPSILARFIKVIKVKADGQLEVHYRTSKPSAFYVSINIKI
ncbi:hypothetical protein [Lysinibacillus odysseyi]|uniref:Uncharacterized protein n=1 Tax=Lysinibacillus odysseyi 34hs-1 = NBRC 100172 TaxID=1220589 RepID=A0A0A3IQH9_9BACI|nr:hypothetical protein [Lysinibacillus odysseyi]KGR86971.1 hypothetical protein CD32_04325 [Lysinibacillus odysseyi 34hs-1 = NBRC 100172]